MIKNFSKIFALILTLIFSASYYTQTLTFSSTNPAVAPANVTLGSIKVPIYSAKIVASGFNGAGANLSSVSFTPTGTFTSSDITKYQFWYNTTNDLTTAINTGPDITTIPNQGTQVTLSPYNPFLGDGQTWYIWITADIKTSAVAGRTLTVGALSTSNFNFSSGSKTGTMSVGGTQTFGSDSDGDGVPDSTDLDDDNDGILDCDENLLGANASVSNVFSFVTAGTAIATSNNEVRLTQNTGNQAGRIWSVGKVDFTKSFVLRFDAYLGTNDNGADGIAAVFHNSPQGVNATGATGLGIGARGIANGIVLELDTYNNGTGLGDISSDHGQIWDSDNQTSTGFLTTAVALPNLENSTWHPVVINWNATTKTISYTVDGTNAGTYTGDLVTNYFAGANKVYFGYTASTGGATNEQKIRINSFCSDLPLEIDTNGDGTPNSLDLDSDNDGCADAIEGSENVKYNQIHDLNLPLADPNYAYRGQIKVTYNGTTTSTPSGIISNSPSANGVPQLLNNAGNNLNASTNPSNLAGAVDNTDGTADIGQGIGDSQDNTINSCKCYKAPSTDGNNYPTQHGITAFNRAGADNQNWPMVRQSGWTALEASTKGFVINRMPVSTSGGNIGEPVDGSNNAVITSPIAGMMFYDTTNDCLKINVDGTRSGWKCFNNQSCPDEN